MKESSRDFLSYTIDSLFAARPVIIFDYDLTIARVPVDWVAARDGCQAYLNENLTGLTVSPGLRMDEMEALALLAYPDERELIFSYRRKVESEASEKHEPISDTLSYITGELSKTFYVLSNNLSSTVITGLRQLKLLNRFEEVIGIDVIRAPKPSIKGLEVLLNLDPHIVRKAIFVGDSERTDGEFCARAGIPFINISCKEIMRRENRYG